MVGPSGVFETIVEESVTLYLILGSSHNIIVTAIDTSNRLYCSMRVSEWIASISVRVHTRENGPLAIRMDLGSALMVLGWPFANCSFLAQFYSPWYSVVQF